MRASSVRLRGYTKPLGCPSTSITSPNHSLYEYTVSETRSLLGDAAFQEVRAEGRAMTFEQAVAYAVGDDEASRE